MESEEARLHLNCNCFSEIQNVMNMPDRSLAAGIVDKEGSLVALIERPRKVKAFHNDSESSLHATYRYLVKKLARSLKLQQV